MLADTRLSGYLQEFRVLVSPNTETSRGIVAAVADTVYQEEVVYFQEGNEPEHGRERKDKS